MTFEEKMKIVINNYFKTECSINTSIREAFEKGFRIGVSKMAQRIDAADKVYQRGLNDAWECMKKITHIVRDQGTMIDLFGCRTFGALLEKYTPGECIEKLRQYEQEKDKQTRAEYNYEEIKDVINTTMKECNVSLDDIIEVLQKMKESES